MTAQPLIWFADYEPRDLRRWTLAAAIVVGVHAALVGSYFMLHEPEAIGDDASVVTVELAPIDSMADAHQVDVAPAPDEMVEQKPTPVQPEKQPDQPKVEEPLPPDTTTAEIAMPVEKPPEQVEEPRAPAPATTAPVKGGAPRIEPSWQSRLVRHLQQHKRYPGGAQSRGEQGIVVLSFSVDRGGHVLGRHIAHSSGHADLDEEVMAMIMRAQPLPPFPASMTQASLDLTVPIRFSLH